MRNLNNKKLLVIGGAFQHCKIVETAKKMGVIVYVADFLPYEQSPAKRIADKFYDIDIFDIDSLVNLCKEEQIDGAIAAYLDSCQNPYQQVCERMGYPCLGNAVQHKILTDKQAFKKVCLENGVDIIPSYDVDDFKDFETSSSLVEYPILVKPTSSRGSRGQSICESYEEVATAIEYAKSESDNGEVIIEKYMGDKFDLQLAYLVINGKSHLLRVEDRFLGSKESRLDKLCIATVTPSCCDKIYREKVSPKVEKMIANLGIINGAVFLQGFMDGDTCRFYDPGIRLPGNDFDRIYKECTSIDIPKMLIEFALTGSFKDEHDTYLINNISNKVTSMLFPDVLPGTIHKIKGLDKILKREEIVAVNFLYKEGDTVGENYNVKQRLCEIDIMADNMDQLKEVIQFIQNHLSVIDTNGKEMVYAQFDTRKLNSMKKDRIAYLKQVAKTLRCDVLDMVHQSGSGHPGGSLSAAEIMSVLYFDEMRIDPQRPKWEGRDRFILSKGHCCPILYASLAEKGYFDKSILTTLRKLHSPLQGHPDMRKLPALDMTSGSLGNGLSIGLGMALASRSSDENYRVFVLMGDGEQQEGAIWEAAMAASQLKVNNLIGIIDYNKLQLTGKVVDVIDVAPLADKWRAFGWNVVEIEGNDIEQVIHAFESIKGSERPSVIIANTIKGKGVSFMENQVLWHSKVPNKQEYEQAIAEINE